MFSEAENSSLAETPRRKCKKNSKFGFKHFNLDRYKTELCNRYIETGHCLYKAECQFAHSIDEIRDVPRHPKYKTVLCKSFHVDGECSYGRRCHFIHEPYIDFALSSNIGIPYADTFNYSAIYGAESIISGGLYTSGSHSLDDNMSVKGLSPCDSVSSPASSLSVFFNEDHGPNTVYSASSVINRSSDSKDFRHYLLEEPHWTKYNPFFKQECHSSLSSNDFPEIGYWNPLSSNDSSKVWSPTLAENMNQSYQDLSLEKNIWKSSFSSKFEVPRSSFSLSEDSGFDDGLLVEDGEWINKALEVEKMHNSSFVYKKLSESSDELDGVSFQATKNTTIFDELSIQPGKSNNNNTNSLGNDTCVSGNSTWFANDVLDTVKDNDGNFYSSGTNFDWFPEEDTKNKTSPNEDFIFMHHYAVDIIRKSMDGLNLNYPSSDHGNYASVPPDGVEEGAFLYTGGGSVFCNRLPVFQNLTKH